MSRPFYCLRRTKPSRGGALPEGALSGDKSVSHRALMFSGIGGGPCRIHGLLRGEDVLATKRCMESMGASFREEAGGVLAAQGVPGPGGLKKPSVPLDFGNAGTAARLMTGLIAGCDFETELDGDASLRKRPMGRVTVPLSEAGVVFTPLAPLKDGKVTLPLRMRGTRQLKPLTYVLPVASAQVKSALLLAGLSGEMTVIEPESTRDHTERMMAAFKADIHIDADEEGRRRIRVRRSRLFPPKEIRVPADPSSAAFPAALHVLSGATEPLVLRGVCASPHRIGFFKILAEMGADVEYRNLRAQSGEDVADIAVAAPAGRLRAVITKPEDAPSMIDEFPALAALAAVAEGASRFKGLAELRAKESDRLSALAEGLNGAGVAALAEGDDLVIHGTAKPRGGSCAVTYMDHRIAMTFLCLGTACETPVFVDDISMINTSFPAFFDAATACGAELSEEVC